MMNAPTAAAVNATAARWTKVAPELADRLERAKALVANVEATQDKDIFVVEGSEGHRYLVKLVKKSHRSECTCGDFAKRQIRCKHILAAALVVFSKES
jgi:uncharacterized Zn finger protein